MESSKFLQVPEVLRRHRGIFHQSSYADGLNQVVQVARMVFVEIRNNEFVDLGKPRAADRSTAANWWSSCGRINQDVPVGAGDDMRALSVLEIENPEVHGSVARARGIA
ncbi:hypothetical protein NKH36_12045 [Mesorhizobium sp. M1312]|uniref:hypothetical protein n=1 Tax=unclassified Mesorhizobium TaxID=325217 RepID=UPI003336768A